MIIINLTGGLGNQMYQYAFGRYLANKHHTVLKYHFTNALFNTQRELTLQVFNIRATPTSLKDLHKFGVMSNRFLNRVFYLLDDRLKISFNKHIHTQRFPYDYDEVLRQIPNDSYVQGYFANPKYFQGIEKLLQKEFTPRKKLDSRNLQLLKEIKKTNSVSLHVRRGDYLTNSANIPKFLGEEFYKKAIRKIKSKVRNPAFYVFSDDIPWCREAFASLKSVRFVEHNRGNNAYKDLLLMAACKHNIIANSTFSEWGSWLNSFRNKTVLKP